MKLKLVEDLRKVRKRWSVRALMLGTVVSFVQLVWAAMPSSAIDRLPLWAVVLISGVISGAGLLLAHIKQPALHPGESSEGDANG